MLVAIDTATRFASLALYDGLVVRAEESWQSSDNHTVELMPSLVRMMARQHVSVQALRGVAVALGPGSFTGLRIGLAVAKGLALAQDIPLLGVPTLDVLAYIHAGQRLPICAVVRAGRGRVCAGHYVRRRGRWRQLGEPGLTTIAELAAKLEKKTLFCGEITAAERELLQSQESGLAVLASPAASLRRAGYLAELAWQRLAQGETDDPITLTPIYLHQPLT
ncbi:MAG: tRNA (adenosine(37)-N6)-threonylcarbamoyltransferase complex dimerization subunit type 1 TsaB [Anaerolineae bacterium]|jgi:tRNA threonylcarbamoyladenosine biosynthesis protein TsaB|nr:tRNA (adenosine(37)-N6)-threonylcarbamoyltransferase complex dimerization subunit type 1 TsaB [Anaerolineae bacterium]MDH7474762.1 tRNA (adenosine(37)-N6)-threonylcarbamoyltransferase complex dimerization subunit type 1 TsaB [Anaerolineae bacterium]